MQVENEKSRVLRDSNWARRDKNRKGKDKDNIVLAYFQ